MHPENTVLTLKRRLLFTCAKRFGADFFLKKKSSTKIYQNGNVKKTILFFFQNL